MTPESDKVAFLPGQHALGAHLPPTPRGCGLQPEGPACIVQSSERGVFPLLIFFPVVLRTATPDVSNVAFAGAGVNLSMVIVVHREIVFAIPHSF